jgi:hypothetical protein
MRRKFWHRLLGPVADDELAANEEVRAVEEVVSRELQASAPAPELEPLAAARGATLVHAQGAFIGTKNDYDLPGTLVPDLELIGLTLEFGEHPLLCLKGHGHGEGLTPCATEDIFWEGVEHRDMDGFEPFASVVGTRLRELTLLSYRGHYCHVGIRLQFESAELVFLNLVDDIEVYDGLVPEVLHPSGGAGRIWQVYEYPFGVRG